jgi:hypothetical protein
MRQAAFGGLPLPPLSWNKAMLVTYSETIRSAEGFSTTLKESFFVLLKIIN